MKKIIGLLIFSSLLLTTAHAQNEVDALRYSQTSFYGTARYMSMGGAFGALGADFSTLSTNPAGIGLYKSSELTFTPSISFSNIDATYNGSMREGTREKFNFTNLGLVMTQDIMGKSKWKNFQFGIGMNRMHNFNHNYLISGVNDQNSMADVFARLANGTNFEVIEEDPYGDYAFDLNPAWWTFLIDTLGGPSSYVSTAPDGPIQQTKYINNSGSMNEVVMAFGANYNDRLYIGASFGFPYIRYSSSSTYTERKLNKDQDPGEFREFERTQDLETRGTGFNFKLGIIARPVNWLRVGGSIQTPTYYSSVSDEWQESYFTRFDTPDSQNNYTYYEESPLGTYDYDLKTPMRASGSIGIIFGRAGLISADYEYVDYSNAKLSAPDYDFISENDAIQAKYTSTHNIRLGTEWRYGPFSIRGGYAIYGSPYSNNSNDGERNYYSFGLGYREKVFFADLAWVHESSEEDYYLYGYEDITVNPSKLESMTDLFMLTFGFRF
ncbi:MAG: hypothetical protein K9G67_04415 [Bacteroidales bacterium]|nr:hypothetical protein [Bacteroidales bacterium]MCF8350718.1 hypothetical protein [Bacteroidales bacterium]MCF8375576.1 hypothetical protein [Bacteroidales bacterium]MCF8402213.1 hypothetical protein [Bacteroidales bacterium]